MNQQTEERRLRQELTEAKIRIRQLELQLETVASQRDRALRAMTPRAYPTEAMVVGGRRCPSCGL